MATFDNYPQLLYPPVTPRAPLLPTAASLGQPVPAAAVQPTPNVADTITRGLTAPATPAPALPTLVGPGVTPPTPVPTGPAFIRRVGGQPQGMPPLLLNAPTDVSGTINAGTAAGAAAPSIATPATPVTPAVAPLQPAATPAASRGSRAAGRTAAAAQPAQPEAALNPDDYIGRFMPGFVDNTLLVPGQMGGGGAPSLASLPGGGRSVNGRFVDPRDAVALGYAMQLQYQQASMQNLLNAAGSGSDLGYHARVAALAGAFGQNNFAAQQTSGVNTINSALGNIGAAGVGAGSALAVAQEGTRRAELNLAQQESEFQRTPRQIGGETYGVPDGKGGTIPLGQVPTMGLPGAPGQGMQPLNPQGTRTPKPREGATGTYQGRAVVYNNGQWAYKQ